MTEIEMALEIYERALRQKNADGAGAVAEARDLAGRGDLGALTRRTADLLGKSVPEVVAARERALAAAARRRLASGRPWVAVVAVSLVAALLGVTCLGGLAFYLVKQLAVKAIPPTPGGALPDPGNLTAYQGQVGQAIDFRVTGTAGKSGSLWGTDVYTTDSSLALAAVHAGALRPGETAVVRVQIVAPPASFAGSTRNGVTSSPWGAYPSAFRVSRVGGTTAAVQAAPVPPPPAGGPAPPDLTAYQGQVGATFDFRVTGTAEGPLWGTDVYTSDSGLAKAAVHAGALKVGETGMVRVRIVAPPPSYSGSTRHGITSQDWGAWPGAFTVSRAEGAAAAAAPGTPLPDPGNLTAYQDRLGQTLSFRVTGSPDGPLWGTDVYTTDSTLATAAVHAGALAAGQTGTVQVKIVAPPPSFRGSTRNGVTSQDWGAYPAAFEVSRP